MFDVLAAWATLVILLLQGSAIVDEKLVKEDKEELVDIIKSTIESNVMGWYKEVNKSYLNAFNIIYGYSDTTLERLTWFGIILTYWIFMTLRLSAWLFDLEIPKTSLLLGIALGISATTVLGVAGIFWSKSVRTGLLDANRLLPDILNNRVDFLVRGVFGSILLSGLSMALLLSFVEPDIPSVLIAAASFPILLLEFVLFANQQRDSYPIEAISHRNIRILCVLFLIATIAAYNVILFVLANGTDVSIDFVGAVGFITLLVPLGVYLSFNIPTSWFNANPLRAMALSIITVMIVGALNRDATSSFVDTLGTQGLIVLSYLAFNMFADTISLQETNWILTASGRRSPYGLIVFLIGDLFLSGLIYVLLPVFVGQELIEFWRGIQFSGDSPWIGILFWSTFSTSALFYLFIGSVAVAKPKMILGKVAGRIGHAIQLDEHPMFFMGVTASIIVTIIFVIYFILSVFNVQIGPPT